MVKIVIKRRHLQNISLIFLGILLSLVILETALRIGGFILLGLQHHENKITDSGGVYRILTLGESTTANLHDGHFRRSRLPRFHT